jgi:ribonuclease D
MPFENWFEIFEAAQKLEGEELPKLRLPSEGLPPPKMWQSKNPHGYARLTHARAVVLEACDLHSMPAENLISPEAIRRVCWPNPPLELEDRLKFVKSELAQFGARDWQIELISEPIAAILGEIEPLAVEALQSELDTPTTESD